MSENKIFTVRSLAVCAVSVSVAFVLSMIRLFRMPSGGSVTLFSMLFAALPGIFYGPAAGILSAFVYALLQFVQNPGFLSIPQVLFDYFLAFGALGLSGLFHRSKYALQAGFLTGAAGRLVFATLASLFFWSEYLPAGHKTLLAASFIYNLSYIGTEAALTFVLLCIPQVQKALKTIRKRIAV